MCFIWSDNYNNLQQFRHLELYLQQLQHLELPCLS